MAQPPFEVSPVAHLATVEIPEKVSTDHNLPAHMVLHRAWPGPAGTMRLEYRAGQAVLGARWVQGPARFEQLAQTLGQGAGHGLVFMPALGLILYAGGADPGLPGLSSMLRLPGSSLLAHKPGRRAVARIEIAGLNGFGRALPPARAWPIADTGRRVTGLQGRAFTVPRLLGIDPRAGLLLWSALPGITLHEALVGQERTPGPVELWDAAGQHSAWEAPPAQWLASVAHTAGRALHSLHCAPPPTGLPVHGPQAEADLVRRMLGQVRAHVPTLSPGWDPVAARVLRDLTAGWSGPALLHRDLHDKQILVDSHGEIGLLDLDTLSVGEAVLDLANLLVHLELRVLQGRCSAACAALAAQALLEGYGVDSHTLARVQAYADGSRLRLACVYTFRPAAKELVGALLCRIGIPILGGLEYQSLGGRSVGVSEIRSANGQGTGGSGTAAFTHPVR